LEAEQAFRQSYVNALMDASEQVREDGPNPIAHFAHQAKYLVRQRVESV